MPETGEVRSGVSRGDRPAFGEPVAQVPANPRSGDRTGTWASGLPRTALNTRYKACPQAIGMS